MFHQTYLNYKNNHLRLASRKGIKSFIIQKDNNKAWEVRLIPNFAELLHEIKLPSAEKCFLIEDGDKKYIEKWIKNGELTCGLDILFEWINTEYKLKKKNLNHEERRLVEDIKKRFPQKKF